MMLRNGDGSPMGSTLAAPASSPKDKTR
jgi:hypothetical protein